MGGFGAVTLCSCFGLCNVRRGGREGEILLHFTRCNGILVGLFRFISSISFEISLSGTMRV